MAVIRSMNDADPTRAARLRYHSIRRIMVLARKDGHRPAVFLPAGKAIDVIRRAGDERFLVVSIDGEQFEVFEIDLMERCIARRRPSESEVEAA